MHNGGTFCLIRFRTLSMKTGSVQFGHIGILGKLNHSQTIETAKNLLDILNNLDVDVAIESHLLVS